MRALDKRKDIVFTAAECLHAGTPAGLSGASNTFGLPSHDLLIYPDAVHVRAVPNVAAARVAAVLLSDGARLDVRALAAAAAVVIPAARPPQGFLANSWRTAMAASRAGSSGGSPAADASLLRAPASAAKQEAEEAAAAAAAAGLRVERLPDDCADFFVCGHGARDARCGECGVPVAHRLVDAVRRLPGGRADGGGAGGGAVRVWLSAHLGGHKYAANVIAFPGGDWYGGVGAPAAAAPPAGAATPQPQSGGAAAAGPPLARAAAPAAAPPAVCFGSICQVTLELDARALLEAHVPGFAPPPAAAAARARLAQRWRGRLGLNELQQKRRGLEG